MPLDSVRVLGQPRYPRDRSVTRIIPFELLRAACPNLANERIAYSRTNPPPRLFFRFSGTIISWYTQYPQSFFRALCTNGLIARPELGPLLFGAGRGRKKVPISNFSLWRFAQNCSRSKLTKYIADCCDETGKKF